MTYAFLADGKPTPVGIDSAPLDVEQVEQCRENDDERKRRNRSQRLEQRHAGDEEHANHAQCDQPESGEVPCAEHRDDKQNRSHDFHPWVESMDGAVRFPVSAEQGASRHGLATFLYSQARRDGRYQLVKARHGTDWQLDACIPEAVRQVHGMRHA